MHETETRVRPDRQREHQANERTFLAWLRTSIALMSFGFVIARFGLFLNEMSLVLTRKEPPHALVGSQTIGVALVTLGVVATVVSAARYERVYAQIERGDFKPERRWVWVVSAVIIALGVSIVPFLFTNLPVPTASPR